MAWFQMRCLVVRWDDIDTTGLKRARSGLSAAKTEFPVPNGIGSIRLWGIFKVPEGLASGSGIAAGGMVSRKSLADSEITSTGIVGFGESFRFHKSNNANVRPSASSVQVSSPSSVLMFQQAMNPGPEFNSVYNGHNQEEQRVIKRTPYVSESDGGKQASSSFCERSFSREDHGGMNSYNQHGISNHPTGHLIFSKIDGYNNLICELGVYMYMKWAFLTWRGERMESALQG
ncbi:hypothetical protein L3X38_021796 [Prunus dulcis]|uniref:Uncharacterized protein n=1 Tax=Prunus dulcis TaxID=3755 RepID=A0AAD4VUQ7_PRUDU|nr:hypothetical protein L3X38_021796 [Prunus dulcis]